MQYTNLSTKLNNSSITVLHAFISCMWPKDMAAYDVQQSSQNLIKLYERLTKGFNQVTLTAKAVTFNLYHMPSSGPAEGTWKKVVVTVLEVKIKATGWNTWNRFGYVITVQLSKNCKHCMDLLFKLSQFLAKSIHNHTLHKLQISLCKTNSCHLSIPLFQHYKHITVHAYLSTK